MQVQFTIPDIGFIVTNNWKLIATLLGAAVLSSIVVELYKRHYLKKKDIKLAKSWVATWVAATSTFFTYLGYVLFIASANMPFLSSLPIVGKYALQVVGIGYLIYNFRLNKWFNVVRDWLHKWSKSDDKTITPVAAGSTAAIVTPPLDEREFTLPE